MEEMVVAVNLSTKGKEPGTLIHVKGITFPCTKAEALRVFEAACKAATTEKANGKPKKASA